MQRLALSLCAMAILAGGCASAVPTKITAENVNTAKGVRYYMTRPYIAVHKPMPLDSSSYLIDGVVSPDGKYIRLTGTFADNADIKHAVDGLFPAGTIPTSSVYKATSGAPSTGTVPNAQGVEVPSSLATAAGTAAGAVASGANSTATTGTGTGGTGSTTQAATQPAPSSPTGTSTFSVTTDLGAVSIIPIRDYFDIVFLTDFDEEYVINPQGNFGDVKAKVALGPGSTLIGLDIAVDNSALTKPLIDAYAEVIKAGVAAGKAALTAATGLPIAQGSTVVVNPPATASVETKIAGSPITLRIHLIKFAAPGVYPVLKDAELRAATTQNAADAKAAGYLIPVYPYSRVAYKYFQLVVVEQLLGDSSVISSGGGAAATQPSKPEPGLTGTDDVVKKMLGISLQGDQVDVVSISDRTPPATDQPITSLTITVKKQNASVTATEASLESDLDGAYKGTKFKVVISN